MMKGIQFVVDETGQKTAVLLDLVEWGTLWNELYENMVNMVEAQSQQSELVENRFGSDAKTISIAADFDAPLADFQDYM